jgi:hypothetical protein
MLGEIILRFLLHCIASAFFVLLTYLYAQWEWRQLGWFVRGRRAAIVFAVICALPTAFLPPLREALDVAAGQPVLKAVTDYISWFLGSGVASWMVYRLRKGVIA